jgi:hypothetical protein
MVKDERNKISLLLSSHLLPTCWRSRGDREEILTCTRERREFPQNTGMCILAKEHPLCYMLVIAQFVYMVTHLFRRVLFVLLQ